MLLAGAHSLAHSLLAAWHGWLASPRCSPSSSGTSPFLVKFLLAHGLPVSFLLCWAWSCAVVWLLQLKLSTQPLLGLARAAVTHVPHCVARRKRHHRTECCLVACLRCYRLCALRADLESLTIAGGHMPSLPRVLRSAPKLASFTCRQLTDFSLQSADIDDVLAHLPQLQMIDLPWFACCNPPVFLYLFNTLSQLVIPAKWPPH